MTCAPVIATGLVVVSEANTAVFIDEPRWDQPFTIGLTFLDPFEPGNC